MREAVLEATKERGTHKNLISCCPVAGKTQMEIHLGDTRVPSKVQSQMHWICLSSWTVSTKCLPDDNVSLFLCCGTSYMSLGALKTLVIFLFKKMNTTELRNVTFWKDSSQNPHVNMTRNYAGLWFWKMLSKKQLFRALVFLLMLLYPRYIN